MIRTLWIWLLLTDRSLTLVPVQKRGSVQGSIYDGLLPEQLTCFRKHLHWIKKHRGGHSFPLPPCTPLNQDLKFRVLKRLYRERSPWGQRLTEWWALWLWYLEPHQHRASTPISLLKKSCHKVYFPRSRSWNSCHVGTGIVSPSLPLTHIISCMFFLLCFNIFPFEDFLEQANYR